MRLSQTVLPFKLAASDELLTAHAELVLFGEYLRAMGIAGLINHELPGAGSAAGYDPSAYVSPLVLMLAGGGRTLEDLRVLRRDVSTAAARRKFTKGVRFTRAGVAEQNDVHRIVIRRDGPQLILLGSRRRRFNSADSAIHEARSLLIYAKRHELHRGLASMRSGQDQAV